MVSFIKKSTIIIVYQIRCLKTSVRVLRIPITECPSSRVACLEYQNMGLRDLEELLMRCAVTYIYQSSIGTLALIRIRGH